MEHNELIAWVKQQITAFADDMTLAEADGNSDYAYAEGAFNAYELMLSKLEENN